MINHKPTVLEVIKAILEAVSFLVLVTVAIYALVCLSPLRYSAIRLKPDLARIFFPPYFYYTRAFLNGRVGPGFVGQSLEDFEVTLTRAYRPVTRDDGCRTYRNPAAITRSRRSRCYIVAGHISTDPLVWLIGHDGYTVRYIRVSTRTPVDS
jgi:hypothetical protein